MFFTLTFLCLIFWSFLLLPTVDIKIFKDELSEYIFPMRGNEKLLNLNKIGKLTVKLIKKKDIVFILVFCLFKMITHIISDACFSGNVFFRQLILRNKVVANRNCINDVS